MGFVEEADRRIYLTRVAKQEGPDYLELEVRRLIDSHVYFLISRLKKEVGRAIRERGIIREARVGIVIGRTLTGHEKRIAGQHLLQILKRNEDAVSKVRVKERWVNLPNGNYEHNVIVTFDPPLSAVTA